MKVIEYVYVVKNENGIHAVYIHESIAIKHAEEINGTVHRRMLSYHSN